jgi:putative flavoprotein involved in K+ transport
MLAGESDGEDVDVRFLDELKSGRVAVHSAVAGFTETCVVFADGSEEEFDAVVAATGFDTGLAELVEVPGVLDAHGCPRFPAGEPTPYPSLCFVGLRDTVRGYLVEANRDSRRLARTIDHYLEEGSS